MTTTITHAYAQSVRHTGKNVWKRQVRWKDWGGYNNFVMHATQIIDNCVYCQCHNNKANLRTSENKRCLRHKSRPISALARRRFRDFLGQQLTVRCIYSSEEAVC